MKLAMQHWNCHTACTPVSRGEGLHVSVGGGGGACVHACKHNLKRHICTQKSEFSDIQVQGITCGLQRNYRLLQYK